MVQEKLSIQEIVEVTQGKLIGKKETTFLLPPQKNLNRYPKAKKRRPFYCSRG